MDIRIGIGLATAGIIGAGTVAAGLVAQSRSDDRLRDDVATRRERTVHQRPGGQLLEGVARSGSALQDRLIGTTGWGGLIIEGLLGAAVAGGSIAASVQSNPIARRFGAAGIGALAGVALGATTLRVLGSGASRSVDEIAADVLALGDSDSDGRITIVGGNDQPGEVRALTRMVYDDPMDFIGTQWPSVRWPGASLVAQYDANDDHVLDGAEVHAMTTAFDADHDGRIDRGEAREMQSRLGMDTWRGTLRTGADRGSWSTSTWHGQGYR